MRANTYKPGLSVSSQASQNGSQPPAAVLAELHHTLDKRSDRFPLALIGIFSGRPEGRGWGRVIPAGSSPRGEGEQRTKYRAWFGGWERSVRLVTSLAVAQLMMRNIVMASLWYVCCRNYKRVFVCNILEYITRR